MLRQNAMERIYARDISEILKSFRIDSMSSTQVSSTSKKLDDGFRQREIETLASSLSDP